MAELKYFNALMATVLGSDEERKAAIQYLKEVDPEIWDQEEQKARRRVGAPNALRQVTTHPETCEIYHK